jgi:N-acetylneuraminic acid mutarotase
VIISDLTPGATIYYTTNGTVPTTSSSVYSTPIVVSTSETLRAIAALTGYTSSGVAVAAYTITASPGSAGDWTWMSGSSQNRQPAGVYGQLGAPASGNTPGGREGTISWTDANGNRWLFGSQEAGFDGNGVYAYLDDVWEYNASTQQWAWMAGSNSVPAGSSNGCYVCTAPPVFGSYQTPAAGNTPGSLQSPVQWTDKAGNLWLFGGYEYQIDLGTVTAEAMNALWEFNVSSHQWAWIGGSDSVNGNAPGVYGSQGQPAPGNTPGGRTGAVTWTDSGGNLWLFGGNGQDSAGITGYLNDLWMFNPTTAQWTWMGGSSTFSAACLAGTGACTAPSVPGTLQTPAAGNMPMGRSGATLWTDLRGNTWLFGGQTEVFYNIGISSGTEGTFINDMWELDANTHEWTWISGNASLTGNAPEFGNSPGVYGSQGMFSAANTPGGRVSRYMQTSETWTDTSGDLWLFGGNGFDSASKVGQLNDLWKFNTSLLKWAWMGGSSTLEPGCINGSTTCSPPGNYGTLGVPASTNGPGARGGAVQWTDQSGNFWIFGGWGTDSVGTWGYLNDLWELNPATALWTWQGGSNKVPNDGSNSQGQLGVYGSLGVPATTNQPGGRTAAAGWFDGSGHLWIFGGYGCDSNYCEGWLNDLWELGQQFSVSAPIIAPAPGTYTSPQSVAITDSTPGATIYYTTNGTTPTASSTVYIGPITVSSSETIEAVAVAGDTNSPIASAAYTITLPVAATPTISLAAGTYTSSQTVSLSDTTPGATIYYAINAAPTTSSTVYSGPISVSASETIETIATASGYTTSAAASANYTISSSGSGPGGWTWMGGSDIEDQPGIYGTLGVPAAGNVPDARSVAASWTDQSGNFWLFGGNVFDANDNTCHLTAGSCVLNDLWKYTPLTGEWAWMNGTLASTPITGGDWGPPGVYGTPGVPFAGNVPGARYTAYSWTDSSGNLWLFGGFGMDAAGNFGDLNDLWKYTPSTGEWTWMSGSSEINQPGVYGTLGVPAAGNVPGARSWGLSWTDPSGNLWLFGAGINDLWKYTPSTGEWTWMSGSDSSASSFPVYGTLGVPAAGNVPGGRYDAVSWTDSSGNLWLFGGIGEYAPVTGYSLSDLWEYTPSTGEWAWMGGSNSADQPAVYGVLGVPAPANQPGARASATAWTDMHGNLWLFGGCPPSGGSGGCLNDLWEYVPSSGMWTWMGGANTKDQSGFYGTLGLPATGNVPGARANPASWTDLSGNLWLFGGSGWDANGNVGDLNDLWRYGIASATNPVAATPTVSPAAGTYTSSQSVTLSDFTPGATIYYTTNGTAPTASSTVYSGAIAVSASETIEAIAVAGGFTNSSVASATYTITLPVAATPAISLAGGTYTGSQTVSLSDTTPGAIIYYTTNGTAPTASSTVYSGAITVSNSETIEAIAVAGGFTNSSVASATYTILTPAAAPVFGPTAGTYSSPQSVTLTDSTPGTTIYYAINATPTTSSTPYTGPITVPGSASETIEAIAAGPDNSSSAVSSATYTILLPAEAPSFNPPAGAYSSPQSVTLTNNAPGTTVYYAINAVPTASSTPYTGTISVSSSETIEAVDVSTAGASTVSALSSAAYTINLAAPTFTLSVSPAGLTMNAGGSSVSTVTVTPSSGFNAQVTLACTGLPAGVTCSFSPATVTPSGSAVTSQLTIAAGAQAMQRRQDRPWVPGSALALAAGLLVWKRWKSVRLCVVVLAAVFGLGLLSGCGQLLVSSVSPPPKTFTVTVSGTSGATTQTASLMLTVN